MNKATILGNGPSLTTVPIPTPKTIGVNASYLYRLSPIAISFDKQAISRMVKETAPKKFVFAVGRVPIEVKSVELTEVQLVETPKFIKYSGPFAYWYALEFLKLDEIYLLGFDMDANRGHFHGEGKVLSHYHHHRKSLQKVWEESGQTTNTKIWCIDKWINMEERFAMPDLQDEEARGRT
jgi:hypothetical protein